MSSEQPPGVPTPDDDPTRPPPRPVAPPGQVSTPDQLQTVQPGEWPAQPPRARAPQPVAPDPVVPEPVAPEPVEAAPPPPPPPPPASPYFPIPPVRRSLAWLWVTLAAVAVLVVGSAATLAVVQPWDDDPSSDRDTTAEPRDSAPSDQGEQSTEPEPVPSEPEVSATPTPPGASGPVTADLNGDGYGDAAAVIGSGDIIDRVVLSSTGTSFKVGREPAAAFDDRTWADFDGDGALDEISWSYQLGGGLTITSEDMDFRELNLRLRLDERQPFVTLKPGDFDGDGAVDLVAYGVEHPGTVSVWVIRNDDGRFSAPEEWMRVPSTTYALTTVLPADFTGDGLTDLAVRVPMDGTRQRRDPVRFGFSFLLSTGSAFIPGPLERPTAFADDAEAVVGDFTGDGTPRVLLIGAGRRGIEVTGLRHDGERLVLDRRIAARGDGDGEIVDAVVSDVDGDRDDDVVYTTYAGRGREYGGFRVLSLGRPSVDPRDVWAPTPRCRARACSFYFQNSY
ncbi:FG-GAP repeat domain-containing protein [Nocardioides immobilis]|uniref:FG-GAP repeat domain-containing protein n=1 Tax=Nocardioides immobilis TaxID=2049295 RepID=UPI0011C49BCB|nr:VCBS repeat-containing protein [Nocardioides immobilis]